MNAPVIQTADVEAIIASIFEFIMRNKKGTMYEKWNASQITSDILRISTGEFVPVHNMDMRVIGIISFRRYPESKRLVVKEIICESHEAFKHLMRKKMELYPDYEIVGKRGKSIRKMKVFTPERLEAIYGRS